MTATIEHDEINHPSHYGGDNPYEAIKVIDNWELDFTLGNCVKYICRAGKKAGHSVATDLRKARWYLDHKIQLVDPENDEQSVAIAVIEAQAKRIAELEANLDRRYFAATLIGKGEEVRFTERGEVIAIREK